MQMNIPVSSAQIEKIKSWLGSGSINIFGLPFAGKDTHGHELAKLFNGTLISGGDILRSQKDAKHVQAHINVGKLAPTDEYMRIVLPFLAQEKFVGNPLILSSVGRWHGEEVGVVKAAEQSNHPLKAVIFLNIGEAEMRKRWKTSLELKDRGERKDDAEHILETRIVEFNEKTGPVIDFYRNRGLLIEVDGMPPRKEVLTAILNQLTARAETETL